MADLDYLAAHAAAGPEDVAVVDGDWVLTRADFNVLVNRYGNVLRAAGVRAGEKVLWVGQNSAEVVAINHAARKVGAVCVPMNYRLAPDEAQYVIDNCDAVVVLFDVEQDIVLNFGGSLWLSPGSLKVTVHASGIYNHPGDDGQKRRDAAFQGYGRTTVDGEGRYAFRTIRPVAYPGRTPHIHFAVDPQRSRAVFGRGIESEKVQEASGTKSALNSSSEESARHRAK